MAFFDKLKEVKNSALSTASNVTQMAKESYEANKQAREERKAAEKAHMEEMNSKVIELANEIVDSILENGKNNTYGFFCQSSQEEIMNFTKDFYEKILLPANSVSTSYISMHPYIDDKSKKKIRQSFSTENDFDNLLVHIKDKEGQEFLLTYEKFYFKIVHPEDKKYFAIGNVRTKDVSQFSLIKDGESYKFMCDNYELTRLQIVNGKEEDFITLNKFFDDIQNQDFEISNEEIDQIIQNKIGANIYQQIKKYMVYDDELAIFFAWGLDSITAKDYIVCTTRQIIMMDREAFGATANVRQYYYEDITSVQTLQNTGDTSITGMLIDAAIASYFKQCDLQVSVAGSSFKISTLNKVEAERVIAIYHQYRKMIKNSYAQPQVVVQQNPQGDILDQIEKLSKLKDAGILTEEEFAKKKTELLAKL